MSFFDRIASDLSVKGTAVVAAGAGLIDGKDLARMADGTVSLVDWGVAVAAVARAEGETQSNIAAALRQAISQRLDQQTVGDTTRETWNDIVGVRPADLHK